MKTVWSSVTLCECCGKIVILLKVPKAWGAPVGEPQRKWIVCYARDWDGNPWFVQGIHHRHVYTGATRARRMAQYIGKKYPKGDPFFDLD